MLVAVFTVAALKALRISYTDFGSGLFSHTFSACNFESTKDGPVVAAATGEFGASWEWWGLCGGCGRGGLAEVPSGRAGGAVGAVLTPRAD